MDTIMFDNWKDYVGDSSNAVKAVCNTVNGTSFEVAVRRYISLDERLAFVKGVVDMCVSGGEYYPAIKELAYNFYRISFYTNVDCNTEIDSVISLIYDTDIINVIDGIVVDNMSVAVNEEISNRLNYMNSVFKSVNDFVESIGKMFEGYDSEKVIGAMADLIENSMKE